MEKNMKQTMTAAVMAALLAGPMALTIAAPAAAQGAPQTVGLVKVDPQTVATGYRGSRIIGASVVNDANDGIGKIDDILISTDGKAPFAVLSVGGFLGMGNRLVVVPYSSLKFADDKIILANANKDELRALPEFKYANK